MSDINVDARLIGIIGKPHGVKGEVAMTLLTDYPSNINRGTILFFDEKCSLKTEVENVKHPEKIAKQITDFLIIKFKGIDDRKQAENLRGADVYRNIEDSPSLKKNQYWTDDITGCGVYTKNNIFIGKVKQIEKNKGNDNLVVEIKNRKDASVSNIKDDILYIPVIKDYIEDIDIESRKVILKKIPEYI
jgi:16S rRNA processing protein RimM